LDFSLSDDLPVALLLLLFVTCVDRFDTSVARFEPLSPLLLDTGVDEPPFFLSFLFFSPSVAHSAVFRFFEELLLVIVDGGECRCRGCSCCSLLLVALLLFPFWYSLS
jgi:hypothetical protein